jgi:hypothetical protein
MVVVEGEGAGEVVRAWAEVGTSPVLESCEESIDDDSGVIVRDSVEEDNAGQGAEPLVEAEVLRSWFAV